MQVPCIAIHTRIRMAIQDMVEEINGIRWQDYDSENLSDGDTDEVRAVRTYPPFAARRKSAVCLGYKSIEQQDIRRDNNLSRVLFGDMKPREQKNGTTDRLGGATFDTRGGQQGNCRCR